MAMEPLSPSASPPPPLQDSTTTAAATATTYDELSMHKSLMFLDSVQDLKKLRAQLYSAAEYFEYSYANDEKKELVVDTLKDYTAKAVVNTVDHLGSMSYKVDSLLSENMKHLSLAELRITCIQQRLEMCQQFTDLEGLVQQQISIKYPVHHKHYVLPKNMLHAYEKATEVSQAFPPVKKSNDVRPSRAGVYPTVRSSSAIKARPSSPTLRTGAFGIAERRTSTSFDKAHSLVRSASQKANGATSISSNPVKRWPSRSQRSASMNLNADIDSKIEGEQQLKKSRSLLKALLSIRRSSVHS
ncbi:protein ABIL2 [Nymphaea colorata]|nr:protein ABIL2 [Nymphaea colorata]